MSGRVTALGTVGAGCPTKPETVESQVKFLTLLSVATGPYRAFTPAGTREDNVRQKCRLKGWVSYARKSEGAEANGYVITPLGREVLLNHELKS